MAEEESEVFEITDFTTASQWERFIAGLEEVIHEWKLTNITYETDLEAGDLCKKWQEAVECLDFAGFQFVIRRHFLVPDSSPENTTQNTTVTENESKEKETESEKAKTPFVWADMLSTKNDFPPVVHHLSRWYGLRDFVVIQPGEKMEDILTESRMNILLSSVAIAINNTGCGVPVFISVHQTWRKLYQGLYMVPGFRTSFETVHLKTAPRNCTHMCGLIDVFKGKVSCPLPTLPPVTVAARFTYFLQDWALAAWSQAPPDVESSTGTEVGISDFSSLPFGSCEDPVESLQLSVTWPRLAEELVVDDETYSDLNPVQAPKWCMRVHMLAEPQCLLGDYLESFMRLCTRRESMMQLLGRSLSDDVTSKVPDVSHALSRLTDPTYGLPNLSSVVSKTTTVVTRATGKLQMKPEEAPLSIDTLNEILTLLFPDAKEDQEKYGKEKHSKNMNEDQTNSSTAAETDERNSNNEMPTEQTSEFESQLQELYKQFKSAPLDSFPYKLAVAMCVVNNYGGVRTVAHLWQEIVLEMRYRWENNYIIPDLEPGSPNMACSLLYQKFQMLNCCIHRKKVRESESSQIDVDQSDSARDLASSSEKRKRSNENEWNWNVAESASSDDDDDDDEFFEAMETADCDNDAANRNEASQKNRRPNSTDMSSSSKRNSRGKMTASSDAKLLKNATNNKKLHESQSTPTHSTVDDSVDNRPSEQDTDNIPAEDTDMDVSFTDTWTHQPEGRDKAHSDLYLLNDMKQPLFVPITQEPAPMTEDMLEEHAEVLAKLGTSNEGTHLRARLQSACLLSDMESFKAANPGAVLGDFVRWYSPRDWVEAEEMDEQGNVVTKGQLSARMQIPGNLWVEVWQNAKPVPARRQRRLFDDTKEAEKVLHWLAGMKPAEVALRLLPMLAHAAIHKLTRQPEVQQLAMFKQLIDTLFRKGSKVLRVSKLEPKPIEEYLRLIARVEVLITQAQSLKEKFMVSAQGSKEIVKELPETICRLLEQAEVEIPHGAKGPLGQVLHKLFVTAYKSARDGLEDGEEGSTSASDDPFRNGHFINKLDFPQPVAKEFIIRTNAPKPAPWSKVCPQRMYCQVSPEEFRLMGAFTSDTTFQ